MIYLGPRPYALPILYLPNPHGKLDSLPSEPTHTFPCLLLHLSPNTIGLQRMVRSVQLILQWYPNRYIRFGKPKSYLVNILLSRNGDGINEHTSCSNAHPQNSGSHVLPW